MAILSLAELAQARGRWWRTDPERRIGTEREALRFIKEQGFVLLVPVRGSELPSIDAAAGGGWGVWWGWKQTLPERRACYYTHLFRRRGTFLSWEWFPAAYAAYGEGKTYLQLFREGRLDRAEKAVLDLLSQRGALMTRELRLAYGPRSKENTRRVKAALVELQRRFLICAAGGSTAGWSHHRWELVERWVAPEALLAARTLSREEARRRLVARQIRNLLATTEADLAWFFGWERREVNGLVAQVLEAGEAARAEVPEWGGEVLVPQPWPGRSRR